MPVEYDEKEYSLVIKRASKENKVTMLPREFCKGTDFDITNETLIKNGGIAIIQTFPPLDRLELSQVKGRCMRHGKSGTLNLVIKAEQI